MSRLMCGVALGMALVASPAFAGQPGDPPSSPFSKLFKPAAAQSAQRRPGVPLFGPTPSVVMKSNPANACSRIRAVPIDPAYDARMKRRAPLQPRPAMKVQQVPHCSTP